ncbi:sulfotransferase domain-containing protein [Octadecabacter sp.]|nr:sulfotransferase domain-containing protein [Octadecabacter sp.]
MHRNVGICSFPKSGNTWLRFLLANMMQDKLDVTYANINDIVPTGLPVKNASLNHLEGWQFYKTHLPMAEAAGIYDKIIYIARDGFDALESYRWFLEKQHPKLFENNTDFLIGHSKFYGFWGEHYDHFLAADDRIHTLRYEDLIENTHAELLNVVKFLDLDETKYYKVCSDAADKSKKDKMRSMSGSDKFMKAASGTTNFIRRGVGGKGEKYWEKTEYFGNIVQQPNFRETMFNLYGTRISSSPLPKKIPLLSKLLFEKKNFKRRLKKLYSRSQ